MLFRSRSFSLKSAVCIAAFSVAVNPRFSEGEYRGISIFLHTSSKAVTGRSLSDIADFTICLNVTLICWHVRGFSSELFITS